MPGLLRLGEEHEDARATIGLNRVLLFVETVRDGQAVAVFVMRGLAVHEEHIVMRLVSGDVMKRGVPRIKRAVADERDLLPAGKRTDNFHRLRLFRPPIGQTPAERARITRGLSSALLREW